jgi:translation initiation factor 2 beta subunit (eIF-2beta)/eIF-5
MLERVFSLLREKNPNLAVRKRHVMPPPQLVRVGTRKTMWANFAQICQLSEQNTRDTRTRKAADERGLRARAIRVRPLNSVRICLLLC